MYPLFHNDIEYTLVKSECNSYAILNYYLKISNYQIMDFPSIHYLMIVILEVR